MKRLSTVFLFAAMLAAPMIGRSETYRRYYDRDRRDWHEWNERENRAYRHWLMEERREHRYREYRRLHAAEQRAYWRWRHGHEAWR